MGVRRYVGCIAALLCAAAWPASALATIDGIAINPHGSFKEFLCVGTTDSSPLVLQLSAPNGAIVRTLTLTTADLTADTGCPASTRTFEPGATIAAGNVQPTFGSYPAGGRITASQDGRSVTFALPYGSWESGGLTRLRALPNPAALAGGVVAASVPGAFDGAASASGATVTVTGSVADSASNPVAITETVAPVEYRVVLDGRSVQLIGADPSLGTVSAVLARADGSIAGRTVLRPRVGGDCQNGCRASGTFDDPAPSGGTLTVSGQAGWFGAHSLVLPQVSLRADGFDVAVPPTTSTGSYSYDLRFFDPASVPTLAVTNPLRCLELGNAADCDGLGVAARDSASAGGLFVVPGDSVTVTASNAYDDTGTVTALAGGLAGTLDDGSLTVRGTPRSLLQSSLRSPRTAPLAPFVAAHTDRTDATGSVVLEDVFPVHIANGAVATLSGPATGPTAQTFQWNLTDAIGATGVVAGTTYPNARVAVDHGEGAITEHLETTANAAGAYSVTLTSPAAGDPVQIAAADPVTRNLTYTDTAVGALAPTITGVADGQFERGTITPTVAGAGIDSVLWNGLSSGQLPSLVALAAPFPYPLDTTRFPDGPYRIEAVARPDPSSEDYRYITIDNTPPTGGAGADQTVAKGASAYIVTGAGDATSGLASVKVDFGDNHRQTISGAAFTGTIPHIYAKLGTFTVLVTLTDQAGNVTSDTAKIRVASTITPAVTGKFPGKIVHRKLASGKLTGHALGMLEIAVLSNTSGARKLTKRVTFTKLSQKITVTLLTRGLKVGRYIVVQQFTSSTGVAGPVQAGSLQVTKAPPPKKKPVKKKT
jgi:hypothetical protein